jgi:hypothetical protein
MDSGKSRSKRAKSKAPKPEKATGHDKSAGRAARVSEVPAVNPEERHQMIAVAAYYRAEQRGFANGDPMQDWLEAEAEVALRLQEVGGGKPVADE